MPPLAPTAAEPLDDLELDGASGSGSDSDESDDVTPEAMARIMELLGDDAAGLLEGEDDEDEGSESSEDSELEAADGEELALDDEALSGELDDGSDEELDGDESAGSLLPEDVSDADDAVVVEKIAVNNRVRRRCPRCRADGRRKRWIASPRDSNSKASTSSTRSRSPTPSLSVLPTPRTI